MLRLAKWILLLGLALVLACAREGAPAGPRYLLRAQAPAGHHIHLAVHPLHNPAMLAASYEPLVALLNREIPGLRVELEPSRDYPAFEAKLRASAPEIVLPNPWQTLLAMKHGYSVIACAGDPADFKGIFLVRKDSGIRVPSDLKGSAVSYPSPTALAACIMPQYYLFTHGVDVRKDIQNLYVGSQESAIMNVYLKRSAAGVTWPPPWRAFQAQHPQEAAELTLIWETPPLINNSVMVRKDLPPAAREAIQRTLCGLAGSAEGQRILAGIQTAGFTLATDADYEKVGTYVARFEKLVRPVEMP